MGKAAVGFLFGEIIVAVLNQPEREASRNLFKYLCEQAGVDHLKVTCIRIVAEPNDFPRWNIETVGIPNAGHLGNATKPDA